MKIKNLIKLIIVRIVIFYDDPEVLIWSNDPEARPHHMLGTDEDFTLTDYSLQKLS